MRCRKCKKIITNYKKNSSEFCKLCKREVDLPNLRAKRKKLREIRRKDHQCIDCGLALEPILVYPCRCKHCAERGRKYLKKLWKHK